MLITDIKIRKLRNNSSNAKLLAIVSVTFDGVFAVHDVKVIQGNDRLFVAMPSRERYLSLDNIPENSIKFVDIAHPVGSEFREYMEKKIICEYHHYIEKQKEEGSMQINDQGLSDVSDLVPDESQNG